MKLVRNFSRNAWLWLRQVTGDAAYENYLRSNRRALQAAVALADPCPGRASHLTPAASAQPLTREQFYLDALRRRYSTISRCC